MERLIRRLVAAAVVVLLIEGAANAVRILTP